MNFGVILPHTKLYGGVKRFFEMGDVFIRRGLPFFVFTPDGEAPAWYTGAVSTVRLQDISNYQLQALFITEMQFLNALLNAPAARKILYFVRPSDNLRLLKKFPQVEVFANSSNSYEEAKSAYKIEAFKAYGGINTVTYYPKEIVPKKAEEPFTILTYGRLAERKKGTRLVVKACEKLYRKGYNIKLILFDTPVNEKAKAAIEKFTARVPHEFVLNHPVQKNVELYHRADVFVSAEKKAGHSNTTAEAMASGIPVIATSSGTKDFLIHQGTGLVVSRWSWKIARALLLMINDFELRKRLAASGRKKIEEYNWDNLAEKVIRHLTEDESTRG